MKSDKKILVVDDNQDLCTLMETILQFNGYNAKACTDVTNLSKTIDEYQPDIMVLDMLLSGQDGSVICKNLKDNPEKNHIKIIMASAHPDADTISKNAGADDFIAKPFDIDIFTDKVNKIAEAD